MFLINAGKYWEKATGYYMNMMPMLLYVTEWNYEMEVEAGERRQF